MSVVAHRRLRRGPAPLLAALATALLLAGCSGSGASSASGGEAMVKSAAGPAAGRAPAKAGGSAAGSAVGRAAAPQASGAVPGASDAGRKLAKQASLRLEVTHLAQAAATVRSLTVSLSGLVLTEQLGDGSTPLVPDAGSGGSSGAVPVPDTSGIGGAYAAFTLSVPAARLDTALAQLGRLGTVVSQTASADDVTGSYLDTQSRVATMKASVQRVRALMSRATNIGQVVTLEGQLSKRQADLESLQAQLANVQASVAQSTISVTLTTAAHHAAPVVASTGFGSGLAAGWHAFTRSITALLTVLGAVLPFAIVLALLGLPVLWWRRQRSLGGQSQPAA